MIMTRRRLFVMLISTTVCMSPSVASCLVYISFAPEYYKKDVEVDGRDVSLQTHPVCLYICECVFIRVELAADQSLPEP